MQRYRVIIADEVFEQLDKIFDFVKKQSPQNARRLVVVYVVDVTHGAQDVR